jgi:short-subunit dehydrogenase
VVTGASAGLGAEFARQLAARGFDLILVARRRDRLETLASELPVNSEVLEADLADDASRAPLEQRLATDPRVEILVNNAGFGTLGYFVNADSHGQDQMHRLHVLATMRLCHAVLPGLVARARGGIINVSSVAGFWQGPQNVSYCSTKTWMTSFTDGLSIELRILKSPVKVQALCPGFTITEFHDVLGMERKHVAPWAWMTAEQVVRTSLEAFDRGKVIVIPGLFYRFISLVARNVPSGVRRVMAARIAALYRPPAAKS